MLVLHQLIDLSLRVLRLRELPVPRADMRVHLLPLLLNYHLRLDQLRVVVQQRPLQRLTLRFHRIQLFLPRVTRLLL